MVSDFMLKDRIILTKPNEQKFENIKSSVQKNTIVLNDVSIPIEEGDLIFRKLPNGLTEKYVVLEANFFAGGITIDPFFELNVTKKIESAINKTLIKLKDEIKSLDNNNISNTERNEMLKTIESLEKSLYNKSELKKNYTDYFKKIGETLSVAKPYIEVIGLLVKYL